MPEKEAAAHIKINKLLEAAGWRFVPEGSAPANICLEPSVKIKSTDLDAFGENFEKTTKGFVDFLLLDAKGFPFIVLEAKAEDKEPLIGKEQARKYARSQCCRFVILSNGNLHYFWDLERGNPYVITSFPTPDSVTGYQKVTPNPERLIAAQVGDDYIVLTQRPNYRSEAGWRNETERPGYIQANKLRFLRPYQLRAIQSLQAAVNEGRDRFLFEMATGTGKTLTAAAVIKLFLRSGNARRVLFLVDRLELEDQAKKAFATLLSADFQTVIYKENRDDWRRAEIVVTTVQSLLFNNKYQKLFSPTDFDLVISDEAHRSIGGNARAVFNYFIGYKLGLTATPRDYLRKFDSSNPVVAESTMLRFLKLIACNNSEIGTYAKLVKDRNESAHANGNIFYSTEAALNAKITEILRVVEEIQCHSKLVIEHCYREFLLQNHDPDEREYPDAADQIREVLIHGNYLSQKDIEICLDFDPRTLAAYPEFESIRVLHEALLDHYVGAIEDERV